MTSNCQTKIMGSNRFSWWRTLGPSELEANRRLSSRYWPLREIGVSHDFDELERNIWKFSMRKYNQVDWFSGRPVCEIVGLSFQVIVAHQIHKFARSGQRTLNGCPMLKSLVAESFEPWTFESKNYDPYFRHTSAANFVFRSMNTIAEFCFMLTNSSFFLSSLSSDIAEIHEVRHQCMTELQISLDLKVIFLLQWQTAPEGNRIEQT